MKSSFLMGVIYKFWNYFYYWSDLPEIYTQDQDVKFKKTLFVHVTFFGRWVTELFQFPI